MRAETTNPKRREMEKQIITGPLDKQQKERLENYMYDHIKDSLQYSGLSIVWHESVDFRGYFGDLDEICDDSGKICDVLDTGDYEYHITDENEADFENVFWSARDKACREYRKKHELNPMTWMAPLIGGCGG